MLRDRFDFLRPKRTLMILLVAELGLIFFCFSFRKESIYIFKKNFVSNNWKTESTTIASTALLTKTSAQARANDISLQSSQCYKKHPNQTFKVCKELPFSEIQCGPKYSRNKAKQEKPYVVPDVIFFIWIGANRTFQYYNYLSIRSAAAVHRPERIDFYHNFLPLGKR